MGLRWHPSHNSGPNFSMWTTGQSDQRQSRLGSAFDEPASPYQVGGLMLRPFSLNVFRRAESMRLGIVALGLQEAREQLPPSRFITEIDALFWLLCAPLDEVREAFRSNRVESVSRPCSVPLVELKTFTAEVGRVIDLARECLFDIEPRDFPGGGEKDDEPADLLTPGIVASLVILLTEKLRVTEDEASEWIPFCRVLQYAHVVQWQNPEVWTISRATTDPGEDQYGEAPPLDDGYGEEIAF